MDFSGVFKVNTDNKTLEPISETDFAKHGFKERYDLQEWIAAYPQILGEKLLIIAKEYNLFDGTNERVDLVALDQLGNLVVIELKRDDSGSNVHWQAIKYASYFARAKGNAIVEIYHQYRNEISLDEAAQSILKFTELDNIADLNRNQRIILGSHRFAREVTCAVLWLRESGDIDIRCVQLIPFHDSSTNSFYLQSKTIIPVPGTEGFFIDVGSPTIDNVSSSRYAACKDDDISVFMASIVDNALSQVDGIIRPDRQSRWAGTWGNLRYYKVWYSHNPWSNHEFSYQTHVIKNDDGKREYAIKFEINRITALERGLTDNNLQKISDTIKAFAAINGLEPVDNQTTLRVERFWPAPELDDNLRDSAAKFLAEMITYFTPVVEQLSNDV